MSSEFKRSLKLFGFSLLIPLAAILIKEFSYIPWVGGLDSVLTFLMVKVLAPAAWLFAILYLPFLAFRWIRGLIQGAASSTGDIDVN